MSPENQWLEDVFPIEIVPFWRTFMSFRGVLVMCSSKRILPYVFF